MANDAQMEILLSARDVSAQAFNSIQGHVTKLASSVLSLQGVATGLAGAAGFGLVAKSSLDVTAELLNNATQAGLTTDAYQKLSFAADAYGITQDALTDGIKELNLRTDEYVQTGAGSAKDAFERLGYSQGELNEKLKDAPGLLRDVISRMEDLDTAAQIRIADEIFGGTGGEQFVQMIDAGAKAFDGLTQKADDLGVVMDKSLIKQSIAAKKEVDQLATILSANFQRTIAELAPDIEDLAGYTADWVGQNQAMIREKVPEYIGNVKDAVSDIKGVYDSIPDGVKGAAGLGLVGTVMFGGTAGKVLFVTAAVNEGLKAFDLDLGHLSKTWKKGGTAFQNIADVLTGKKDWNTGELKEGVDGVTLSINQQTEGWNIYKGAVTKAIDSSTKGYKKYQDDIVKKHGSSSTTISNKNKKTNRDEGKLLNEFNKLYEGYQKSQTKTTISSLEKQFKKYEKVGADKEKVEELLYSEITKYQDDFFQDGLDKYAKDQKAIEKAAEASASAYETMYSDMEWDADGYFDYQEQKLKDQATAMGTAMGDMDKSHGWYTKEHGKLVDAQKKAVDDAYEAAVIVSDDFFGGVLLGLKDSEKDFITWGEAGRDITNQMTSDMSYAFSDTLFSTLKGDFDSIGDVWQGVMDGMLKSLTDTIATMLINWAVVEGMDFVGSLFGFESGAWDLDIGAMYPDSKGQAGTPAVVHQGEMIIPASIADAFRTSLESEGVTDFDSLEKVLLGTSTGETATAGVTDLLWDAFSMYNVGHLPGATALKNTDWTDPENQSLANKLIANALGGTMPGIGTDKADGFDTPMYDFYQPAYEALIALPEPYAVINDFVGSGGKNIPISIAGGGVANTGGWNGATAAAAGDSAFMSDFAVGMGTNLGFSTATGLVASASIPGIDAGDIFGMAMSTDALLGAAASGLTTAINSKLGSTTDSWGKKTSFLGKAFGGFVGGLPGALAGAVLGAVVGNTVGDALDARDNESIMDAFESQAIEQAQAQYGSFFGAVLGQVQGDKAFSDMAKAVNATHGGKAINPSLLDPINFNLDYGFTESGGYGTGTVNGIDTGGGFGDMAPGFGGAYGYHGMKDGGVIDQLVVPAGEDGFLPVQFGEGVVSRAGMSALAKINDGSMASADPEAIGKAIAKELIANMATSGNGQEIHIHLDVNGSELAAVVARELSNGHFELIQETRKAVT